MQSTIHSHNLELRLLFIRKVAKFGRGACRDSGAGGFLRVCGFPAIPRKIGGH